MSTPADIEAKGLEAASTAVMAEWQAMLADMPGLSPGDVARAFVSPTNHRLLRAGIRAYLDATLEARVADLEGARKDWLDEFDNDRAVYTDHELIDLLGMLLNAQVREGRINSIEELYGMLRQIGRSQRARSLTGDKTDA